MSESRRSSNKTQGAMSTHNNSVEDEDIEEKDSLFSEPEERKFL